jgi:hypothetical protein
MRSDQHFCHPCHPPLVPYARRAFLQGNMHPLAGMAGTRRGALPRPTSRFCQDAARTVVLACAALKSWRVWDWDVSYLQARAFVLVSALWCASRDVAWCERRVRVCG